MNDDRQNDDRHNRLSKYCSVKKEDFSIVAILQPSHGGRRADSMLN